MLEGKLGFSYCHRDEEPEEILEKQGFFPLIMLGRRKEAMSASDATDSHPIQ